MLRWGMLNQRGTLIMKNKFIALSIVVVAMLAACSDNKKDNAKIDAATPLASRMTVEVVRPTKKTVQESIKTSGTLAPINEVIVSAEIGGQKLSAVYVDVGQYVKRGQILAKLNTELLEKDINVAQATLLKAKAALELSTFNYENSKKLKQSSAISEQDLMQAKAQFASNTAEVIQYQAQLDSLKIKQKYATIVAPVDGVVSAKSAIAGSISNAGVELFRIIKEGQYEWRAEVSSENYALIHLNQQASFSWNNTTYEGRIYKISPSLDSSSKKIIAYIKPSTSKALVAGAIVSGVIVASEKNILSLPESSFIFDQGKSFVFKIKDGKVFKTLVQTGGRYQNDFEILSPLSTEEEFVKTGAGLLVDGDSVSKKKEAQ